MKKLIFLILLFCSLTETQAAKTKFFITYRIEGDSLSKKTVEGVPGLFITLMANSLIKEFKCTEYNSIDAIRTLIGWERMKQLVGSSNDEEGLKNIAGAMGADYLIFLTLKAFPNSVMSFSIGCIEIKGKQKNINTIAYASGTNIGNIKSWDKVLEDNVKDIIDQLARYEICPYTGPVSVSVVTEKKEESKEEYEVYCSKQDRTYKKTTVLDKKSSADWKLEKIKKIKATGTINYSMAEKTEIEENDPCYKCETMISGNRNYSDISTNFLEINGLSKGDESKNEYYSTVELKFLKDGTYTLTVKAASEKGDLHTMRMEKATGECQAFETPAVNRINKSDIGIRETLGPFPGTGKEKVLQEKQTIEKTDPVTNEKTTITYDFNLRRD